MQKLIQKMVFLVLAVALLGAGCIASDVKNTYSNEYLTVGIQDGWIASEAAESSAVNITKGNWILHIDADATQASGVTGGRFAEIGMGAPSVDAVVTEQPSTCGMTQSHFAFEKFTRVDYLMSAADEREWCTAPTNGKTVWFFSYLTSPNNGFFNYGPSGQAPGLVITMAYDTDITNNLPEAGSENLEVSLREMTEMASTLELKKNPELLDTRN